VSDKKDKPVLDEQNFEKLLEAAYVLQGHSRKMQDLEARMESHNQRLREQEEVDQAPLPNSKPKSEKARASGDYTLTLAEIVEAQRQIQARHLDLDRAMAVIAEKVARIATATGAAIGILEGKTVYYRAGAGVPALPLGTEVPLATAICAASVRTGQVIRSEDVNTEVLFDPEPVRERGILSLLAVPIYHDGDIVGGLELYFDKVHGYAEQDIHTCQLMAGLVTEAIGRDAESKMKKSMAEERSTMLAAIEKLQPNLAALAEEPSAKPAKTNGPAGPIANSPCWKCGNALVAEEQFCGKCGAARVGETEPSSMQSKLASAWHRHVSPENLAIPSANLTLPLPRTEIEEEAAVESLLGQTPRPEPQKGYPLSTRPVSTGAYDDEMVESLSPDSQVDLDENSEDHEDNVEPAAGALMKPQPDNMVWSSAAKTRDFLESLSGTRTKSSLSSFWQSRRGDFYLAVAVILIVVVVRWGISANHPVGATSHGNAASGTVSARKPPAPEPELSTFDRLLISLGLADAPETPPYKGNPDAQVWIDLQTALYYCPGSDLYGKTLKGRLSSQRDAQLDQFEPANRKPCD
jgi:putative methionine-R-sulfoxide reductase with GAF domain